MLLALARSGSSSDVGLLALGFAVTAPVYAVTDLNLRVSQASDAVDRFSFQTYLALRLSTAPLAFLVTLAIAVVVPFSGPARNVVIAGSVLKVLESLEDVHYGMFQRRERLDLVAFSQIMKAAIGLPLFVAIFINTKSVAAAVVGSAAAAAITLVAHDHRRTAALTEPGSAYVAPVFARGELISLARVSAPLGAVAGINALTANTPRYLIEIHLGTAALGVFASLAYVLRAMNLIANSIYHGAVPRLAQYHASGSRERFTATLRRLLRPAAVAILLAIVLAATVGSPIAGAVLGTEYAVKSVIVILTVAAALGLVFSIVAAGLLATRVFGQFLMVRLAVFAATAVSAAVMTNEYGLPGAAWSLVIGSVTGVGLTGALLKRQLGRFSRPASQ